MAKSVHSDVLDAALAVVGTSTAMVACTGEPATFAEADGALKLAAAAMTGADFTLADGDTSGRKLTVGAKSGVGVVADGTATHVALLDVAGSRLLYVTTCAAQPLASGGTVGFAAWDIEIADPA